MFLFNVCFFWLVSIINCFVVYCWIFILSIIVVIKLFLGVIVILKEEIYENLFFVIFGIFLGNI